MKQTVLVTGGIGYIGSHTVVELIESGYNVVVIDNLSNSQRWIADRIEQITGKKLDLHIFDLCEKTKLSEFINQYPEIGAIIHFAASKAVGESVTDSLTYYENNLVSLMNLLNIMRKHAIPNLVFSSSCTVYGQPEKLPVTEESPILPATSPYGNTKQIAEEIIRDAITSYKSITAIALRYFNPIGAHSSALIGELPNGVPNNLVPFVTQTAAGKREKLSVFGNDYNTPDGSCIRDYINVVDLAKAHVVAVDRLFAKKNLSAMEYFNLGTGTGVSVLELIKTFEAATGVKVPYHIVDRRPGDIETIWAETSKANKVLGWKATISLEETLRSAWAWEQKASL